MKKIILSILVSFSSFIYASTYWLNDPAKAQWLTSTYLEKPFVYRQLVPFLARLLVWMKIEYALVLVVFLFGLTFYLSLRYFIFTIHGEFQYFDEVTVLSFVLGLSMFSTLRIPYDLATAFFFTLSYALIVKDSPWYIIVFPLATLNRETTFLLILFYLVYKGCSFEWLSQIFAFGAIQGIIRLVFWDNVGLPVWFMWKQNMIWFSGNLFITLCQFTLIGIVLWICYSGAKYVPEGLYKGFLVLAPVCIILYVVLGAAFEVRVFWEIYPLVVVLFISTIKEFYNEKIQTRHQKVQSLQSSQDIL